jgi:hypothetical protein
MRTNFTLGLMAIVLGFGIANAAAAGPDASQTAVGAATESAKTPDESLGHFGAGLSAIKSGAAHKGNALVGEGTSLMDESHSWSSDFSALTGGGSAALETTAERQAMMTPPGPSATGLAALKAGATHGGSGLLGAASEGSSGLAMQRPEGASWSDGLNSLRRH